VIVSVPLYAVALVMRETLGVHAAEKGGADSFGTVALSLFTTFRCFMAGDCTDDHGVPIFSLVVREHGWVYGLVYIGVVAFMEFGLFNVITSTYVEKIMVYARHNEAIQKQWRMTDKDAWTESVQDLLLLIYEIYFKSYGDDDAMRSTRSTEDAMKEATTLEISREFFQELCDDPRFMDVLNNMDISAEDRVDLFDTMDADGGGTLELEEMLMAMAKLRGKPRRSDLVNISLVTRNVQTELRTFLSEMRLFHTAVMERFEINGQTLERGFSTGQLSSGSKIF